MCAWSTLHGQNEKVLVREDDEGVTGTEERQQALGTLLEAGRRALTAGESAKAAGFMNRAGRLQVELNLPSDSLATYQGALKLVQQATDSSVRVDSLNGIATAYTRLSKCDQARPSLQEAIASSERSGYVPGKAEALLTQAACQKYKDHAGALRSAREALGLWQSVNRKWWVAMSYAVIGHYQLAQNNLIEATANHEEALKLWRELNNVPEQAEALINLGFIEYRKGAWQASLSFLTEALGLLDEKAEPFKMGQITTGIGEAFIESGLPETGLPKLQQALAYYRLAQNPRAVIILNWDIGRTHYLMGDYPQALANLETALTDAEAIRETAVAALCHDFLGRTYDAMNDRAAALGHFQTAFESYTRVGKRMEAARTQALLGQVYQQQGKFEAALKNYHTALQTFRDLSDHLNESATLFALGNLELRQNNLDEAEKYLRQSIEVTENMRRVSSSSDLAIAFSASVYERYQSYVECLMRKNKERPDQGFAAMALETSELGRARSLGEMLRSTETGFAPGVDLDLVAQEKALRQSLRVKEDYRVRLLAGDYQRQELASLESELARLERDYKQVAETIKARYPTFERLARPSAWTIQQIQEHVVGDDQTVLLEYSLGADKSYVWAVTRNDIKSYELPARARINEAAQKVYTLLTTTDPAKSETELTQATRELGQMVLSPVAAELNKRRMIVVADGALHYIPFQILPASSDTDQPLVATTEVSNAPSASILGQLQQETARRQTPAKALAAFGDPVFASNYEQRKQTDTEANQRIAFAQAEKAGRWPRASRDIELVGDSVDPSTLQSLFYSRHELANLGEVAGPQSLMVTSFEATREKLASLDLTNYAILHFATHGVLNPKRPEKSGLFLSMVNRQGQEQNGFVGLQDIYSLHAPVELVVLSACSTGLGKDVRGEGLIGLTRGFLYAGASSVVASLWKVDDEATAELMKQFYANMLQHKMAPASALREAQNSIRRQPQWRSPYYWAAFTLQGDSSRVIKIAPGRWMPGRLQIVFGLSLILLLAGAALWYRRSRLAKS
jgi:CHAT domain-containing protein/uncharacterized protein HemY